ncbi:SUN domain-containing protein 1 isoform X3 [Kryptolebias marmoratus]|uniref:SUN domain-containing protein 1 isoform X3 n=1 Tax=Kryptolebias marmoratus TaxID=37003 RepID=UPI0007F8D23C|nr:SUN domain-containing protein 1 isoform X3 [Kryptolebias marmoratus]
MSDEDEDLQSWGWTDLSSYSSSSDPEQTGVMSRCSLRLNEGLLDRGLPQSGAPFSVGGVSWRSSRSVWSGLSRCHSASCSESLLLLSSPHKAAGRSVASDASLISSLLDESSIQESTLVDTFWGLDQDADPKDGTVVAEERCTLIGSDGRCNKHLVQNQNHSSLYCKDCSGQNETKDETETSTIYCRDRRPRTARPGLCGTMNLKDVPPVGSLCDDCKEKQLSKPDPASSSSSSSSSWSSGASWLLALVCSAALFTASALLQVLQRAAAALWPLTKILFCAARRTGRSAGGSAAEAFRWISRRWSHMTSSSLLNSRFLLRLFIVLLPLLLLLSLCWFGPAGFCSVRPGTNITAVDDVPGLSSVHSLLSPQSQSAEGAGEAPSGEAPSGEAPSGEAPSEEAPSEEAPSEEAPSEEAPSEEAPSEEAPLSRPPAAATPTDQEVPSVPVPVPVPEPAPPVVSGRLVQVEQSLMVLWERVESAGRWAERRHREVLQLHADLHRQQPSWSQSSGDGVEPWISDLLDRQLFQLRAELEEDRRQREEIRQQDLLLLKTQNTRLDHLELQLHSLAARTQEVQRTPEASAASLPAAVSAGVDRRSHDALQAEVLRLEAALGDVRRDVQGLSLCQNGLDRIQQMVSEQVSVLVQEEIQALMFGNQLTARGDSAPLPESLLRWLSERFVTEDDLQEALSALERSILQNVSRKLQRGEETCREDVLHAAEDAGNAGNAVSQEAVRVMVTDALRLFAQDRIGLADYALESGGGSILSTRCSETYETKAALLSLFGLPLWYFSQSPRAVIQPDVHPGNCWAFKGSKGFLVIQLSMRILPTAVTMEHVPKVLAPSRTLRSAPRDFSVYGLRDESQEEGKLLGSFTYEEDGEDLQTFSVSEENHESFQIIEVQVLSNWGHPDYTCMYRFRVHGTPSDV